MKKKRMLSILLALAMILTFMPAMAFAGSADPVAKIGDKTFDSLQQAVNQAEGDVTIELLKDISLDDRVDIERGSAKTTIDLAGNTITPKSTCINGSAFNIKSGTVEIKNGSIDGTAVEEFDGDTDADHKKVGKNDGVSLITVRSGSTLNLNDPQLTMTINSKNGSCVYPFAGGSVNIGDGVFINKTTEAYQYKTDFQAMTINQANNTSQLIFVKGGTFVGNDPARGDDSGQPSTFLAEGYGSYEGAYEDETGEYDCYKVEEVSLHDAKVNAWDELFSTDTSKYSGDELAAVEKAIDDGAEAIGNATTIAEVEAALSDAKAAIAKQMPLADAKKAATAELDKIDQNKYSDPEKTAVANAIAAAKKDIAAAGTVAAVNAAKTAALNAVATQPMLNESLPVVKTRKGLKLKKAFKARWKKLSKKNLKKISGYEVQYAKDANFTDSAKIVKAGKKNTVKTVRKLPKKSTYWVRVRTYKVTDGVKTVGAWSKVRKVKTR